MENEQAERGTGRPNPSREEIKFSGATGDDREMLIFSVQLTTSRIGNLTRLVHILLFNVMTMKVYRISIYTMTTVQVHYKTKGIIYKLVRVKIITTSTW